MPEWTKAILFLAGAYIVYRYYVKSKEYGLTEKERFFLDGVEKLAFMGIAGAKILK